MHPRKSKEADAACQQASPVTKARGLQNDVCSESDLFLRKMLRRREVQRSFVGSRSRATPLPPDDTVGTRHAAAEIRSISVVSSNTFYDRVRSVAARKVASGRTWGAHIRGRTLFSRVGRILHDVSHAAAGARAHIHRRVDWFGSTVARLEARFCQSACSRSYRDDGWLLRELAAYEANRFDENNAFLIAPSVFPYFYALVGERNPKQAPRPKPHSDYSQLACDAFELIRRDGPISKQKMRDVLGGSVSFVALDHPLGELWSRLRITRVDYNPAEGAFWDVLYRWSPDAVRAGVNLSVGGRSRR